MFDNPEIRKLQQDVDALAELIANLIEAAEMRHAEILNKLETIEDGIAREVSSDDIEDIKTGIEEVKQAVEDVEGALEDA